MPNQKDIYSTDNQIFINSEQFEKELDKIIKLGEYLKKCGLIIRTLFIIYVYSCFVNIVNKVNTSSMT